jgi:hypothetical protein
MTQVNTLVLYGLRLCYIIYKHVFNTALSSSGDYVSTAVDLTYAIQSASGSIACISVTLNTDLLVECDETFNVNLTIAATGGLNLNLGISQTSITLTNTDSRLHFDVVVIS